MLSGILLDRHPDGHFVDNTHHYIFANSISGRSFVRSLFDEPFANNIGHDYTGGIISAAHFSSPFRDSKALNLVYPPYARLFWNFQNGQAPLDWALPAVHKVKSFIKNGTEENANYIAHFSKEGSPTHGQIMSSIWSGEALERELSQKEAPQAAIDFPLVMFAGSEDFVSKKSSIQNLAEKLGAEFMELNANHDLSLQSRNAQNFAFFHMCKAAIERDIAKSHDVPIDDICVAAPS